MTAMCNPGGPARALRCQPLFDIKSPTSKMLKLERFEVNATTEAGGDPSTYRSGISVLIASAILRVVVTIDRQDSRYPLRKWSAFLSQPDGGHVTLIPYVALQPKFLREVHPALVL